MELIKLVNIGFETARNTYDLENINLVIEENKTYGILGAKNNGKTALLTLLAGLNRHTSGEMYLFGKDAKNVNLDKYRAKEVGFLFSYTFLEPYQTVRENLELIYAINNKNVNVTRILKCLEDANINKSYLYTQIKDLTEFEKQKVVVARTLLKDCKIILAKNPGKTLSEEESDEFLDLLLNICKEKKITLILTTESNYVCKNLDHVYGMNKGMLNSLK